MTKDEISTVAMPLIVVALGWVAMLVREWDLHREDRAFEDLLRFSPPVP